MVYELEIAWRTARREGLGSLFAKLGIYLRQLALGMSFMCRPLPRNLPPAQLVDFAMTAGHGFLQTSQVRSEIVELANLVAERRPRTVVEIGTAHGGTLFLWCRRARSEAVKNEHRTREFVHDTNQGTCGIGVIEV